MQNGDTFKAEIFVPVWTSQLFISDWWQPAAVPLAVTVTPQGEGWQVKAENRTENKLTNAKIAIEGNLVELGDIPAKKQNLQNCRPGMSLKDFVSTHGQNFSMAAHPPTALAEVKRPDCDMPNSTVAASFFATRCARNFCCRPAWICPRLLPTETPCFLPRADYTRSNLCITLLQNAQNTMWRVIPQWTLDL